MNKAIVEVKDYEGLKRVIMESKDRVSQEFQVMGMALLEISEKELYKGEYEDFKSFCDGEGLSYSTSKKLKDIVKTFKIQKGNMLPLSWGRTQKILPAVRENPKKRDEIIEMAENTPFSKLDDELILYRKEKIKTFSYSFRGTEDEVELVREEIQKLAEEEDKSEIEIIICLLTISTKDLKTNTKTNTKTKDLNTKTSLKNKKKKVDVQDVIDKARDFNDLFCDKHLEYRKSKYLFKGAKDMQLSKKMAKVFTRQELSESLDKFFQEKKRWWGNKFSVGVFFSCVNDYMGKEEKGKYADFSAKQQEEE